MRFALVLCALLLVASAENFGVRSFSATIQKSDKDKDKHKDPCTEKCKDDYKPVCGTDGNWYRNSCILKKEACNPSNKGLAVAPSSTCPSTINCATTGCEKGYSCVSDLNSCSNKENCDVYHCTKADAAYYNKQTRIAISTVLLLLFALIFFKIVATMVMFCRRRQVAIHPYSEVDPEFNSDEQNDRLPDYPSDSHQQQTNMPVTLCEKEDLVIDDTSAEAFANSEVFHEMPPGFDEPSIVLIPHNSQSNTDATTMNVESNNHSDNLTDNQVLVSLPDESQPAESTNSVNSDNNA